LIDLNQAIKIMIQI